ncbi:uncharacterized protein BDR25DRAFT_9535 [Lindgomyces ingoldianus]|uniref:Uncharacterized protein n=1 Tax=Lindgomyces ingoldianus TaxID=673940 RepID=A0ACB6RII6_9PLEO|nr:uncharacterized protein BDR25DRAFT_9535 [Lindgomyces ingoldianus]KAF2478281.1 hypothetical protein BDR25DRAFT_9535 [Lindgomyces ingoldianus]
MVSASIPAGTSRLLLACSHFMTWASSAIVVGITGYFLNDFDHNQHLIFWIVIAAMTLCFWLPSFALPFMGSYKNWYLPMNFVFSYLWLTSFIFAAQDYNWHECEFNSPTDTKKCSLKKANEAFFTLLGLIVETLRWKGTETSAAEHPGKERASVETGATA